MLKQSDQDATHRKQVFQTLLTHTNYKYMALRDSTI